MAGNPRLMRKNDRSKTFARILPGRLAKQIHLTQPGDPVQLDGHGHESGPAGLMARAPHRAVCRYLTRRVAFDHRACVE